MSETVEQAKRPISITVICVLGFIGALIVVPLIFSDLAQQIGAWYPPYLGLSSIVGLVCMVGLWMMKKWAAYTYTAVVLINQVILIGMGVWTIMALVIPAIIVFFALANVNKMT
ncbi:MAG: hypothetical protein ACK5M4_12810 [Pseudorhodobacter sp.]